MEICTYCNDVHEFIDFGKNLKGEETLVCPDRLADALAQTMPKVHDEIDAEFITSSQYRRNGISDAH